MVALLINNCNWVINCQAAFEKIQGGDKNAMPKAYEN
jgi:hypothetical protein